MQTEQDITPRANWFIWGFFFIFTVVLYLTISGLTIYFKTEAEREYELKIALVKSQELLNLRQQEEQELKGIQEAMEQVIREFN